MNTEEYEEDMFRDCEASERGYGNNNGSEENNNRTRYKDLQQRVNEFHGGERLHKWQPRYKEDP